MLYSYSLLKELVLIHFYFNYFYLIKNEKIAFIDIRLFYFI